LVVMVGTSVGDSGGDGTLKFRPHTAPNGHRFWSGAGHWLVAGAVEGGPLVAVAPSLVVGVVLVVDSPWWAGLAGRFQTGSHPHDV
jgi:hypothetical protein